MEEDAIVWEDMLRSSLDKPAENSLFTSIDSASNANSYSVKNDRIQIQTGHAREKESGSGGSRGKKYERGSQRGLIHKPSAITHASTKNSMDPSQALSKTLVVGLTQSNHIIEEIQRQKENVNGNAVFKDPTVSLNSQLKKNQSGIVAQDVLEMPLSFTLGQSELFQEPSNDRTRRKPDSPLSMKINQRLTLEDAPYILKALVTSSLAFEFWNEQVYHLPGKSTPTLMIRGLESVQNRLWAGQSQDSLSSNSSTQMSQMSASPYEKFDSFVDDVISVLKLRARWSENLDEQKGPQSDIPPMELAIQLGESIIDSDSFLRGLKLIDELRKLVSMSPEEVKEYVAKTIHASASEKERTDRTMPTPSKGSVSSGTLLGMITVMKKSKDSPKVLFEQQENSSSSALAGPLSSALLKIDHDSEKTDKAVSVLSKFQGLKAQTLEKWFKPTVSTPLNVSPKSNSPQSSTDDRKLRILQSGKLPPLKLVDSPQFKNAVDLEAGNSPVLDSGSPDFVKTPNQINIQASKSPHTFSLTRKRRLTFPNPNPLEVNLTEKFNAQISSESNSPAAKDLFSRQSDLNVPRELVGQPGSLLHREPNEAAPISSIISSLSDQSENAEKDGEGEDMKKEDDEMLSPTQIDQHAQLSSLNNASQMLMHTSSDSLFLTACSESKERKSPTMMEEEGFTSKKRAGLNDSSRNSKRLKFQNTSLISEKHNADDENENLQVFLTTPLSDTEIQLKPVDESEGAEYAKNSKLSNSSAVADLIAGTDLTKIHQMKPRQQKSVGKEATNLTEGRRYLHFSLLPLLRDLPGLDFRVSASLFTPNVDKYAQVLERIVKLDYANNSLHKYDTLYDVNPQSSSSAVTTRGLRSMNQDACFVRTFNLPDLSSDGSPVQISSCSGPLQVTAVCDGHGPLGKSAAFQTASFLCGDVGMRISTLEGSGLTRIEAIQKGMKESVKLAHELLVGLAEDQHEILGSHLPDKLKYLDYGTTISLAVVDLRVGSLVKNEDEETTRFSRPVYLLNVGDSQAAIFVRQSLPSMSVQANPSWFNEIDDWVPGFSNWIKGRSSHHTSSVFKAVYSTVRHDPFTMPEEFDRLWRNGQVVLVRSGGLPPIVLPQYEKPEANPSTTLQKLAIDLFRESSSEDVMEDDTAIKSSPQSNRRSSRRQKDRQDYKHDESEGISHKCHSQAKSVRVFPANMNLSEARHSMLTLNMSRALGHRVLKNAGVSSEPSGVELVLVPTDEPVSIVLGTDGLWDKMDVKEVAQLLTRIHGCCVPRNERNSKRPPADKGSDREKINVCAKWLSGADGSICASLKDAPVQNIYDRFSEISKTNGCPKSLLCALLLTSLAEGRWRSCNSESDGSLYGDNTSVCVLDLPVSD